MSRASLRAAVGVANKMDSVAIAECVGQYITAVSLEQYINRACMYIVAVVVLVAEITSRKLPI